MKKSFLRRLISMAIVLLILSLPGCVTINLGGEQPNPTPSAAPVVVLPPTASPALPGLTADRLLNAEFLSPLQQVPITLVNGEFSGLVDGVALNVKMMPDIQFGDLNEDGIDDAVVIVAENTGGTGSFYSLVVFYSRGEQFAQAQGVMIDDRPVIESLSIEDGVVKLSARVHGPNDPMVDPTTQMSAEYSLLEDNLVMTNLISAFGGGADRVILIESPRKGDLAGATVRVTGSMAIAPFENNLSLEIRDMENNQLLHEGFMVTSEDLGASATFDNVISLPNVTAGTRLLLVLSEVSMADGSPMALASVLLTAGE